MNKKIIISIFVLTAFLIIPIISPVMAYQLGLKKLNNQAINWQNQASKEATNQQDRLVNIINKANTMISDRITSLNNLITKVQNDNNLSSSEKTSLISEIQTQITNLDTLKTKIDSDTDFTAALSDTKQIVTNYYVYAYFEPKTRLLIIINNLQTVTTNLQALVPQIQNLINNLKSQGKDVSSLQPLLDDISSQLQTIATTLTSDTTTLENTTMSNSNQSTFVTIRQNLAQVVRSGFAKIRSDVGQMRPILKSLILPSSNKNATVSATPETSSSSAK